MVLTVGLLHCSSVCKADQHLLSADGPGGAQYLTIEVGGALGWEVLGVKAMTAFSCTLVDLV